MDICENSIKDILTCMKKYDTIFDCQQYYNILLKCDIKNLSISDTMQTKLKQSSNSTYQKCNSPKQQKYYNYFFDTVSSIDEGSIHNDYKYKNSSSGLSASVF